VTPREAGCAHDDNHPRPGWPSAQRIPSETPPFPLPTVPPATPRDPPPTPPENPEDSRPAPPSPASPATPPQTPAIPTAQKITGDCDNAAQKPTPASPGKPTARALPRAVGEPDGPPRRPPGVRWRLPRSSPNTTSKGRRVSRTGRPGGRRVFRRCCREAHRPCPLDDLRVSGTGRPGRPSVIRRAPGSSPPASCRGPLGQPKRPPRRPPRISAAPPASSPATSPAMSPAMPPAASAITWPATLPAYPASALPKASTGAPAT